MAGGCDNYCRHNAVIVVVNLCIQSYPKYTTDADNLYVSGHVLAGLVLAQRCNAACVEDVLPDERTRHLTDEASVVGGGDGRLRDCRGARHRDPGTGGRRRHWKLIRRRLDCRLCLVFDARLFASPAHSLIFTGECALAVC